MPHHDIVVIGGSLGAVEPLQEIVHKLPSDLRASVFVVIHIPADSSSVLHKILSEAGWLEAHQPADGERIEGGKIYVAPPDRHLTIEGSRVRVLRGPRENRHRPAIDPLFRTAARYYGPRVVGVLLSGRLDDGSAGLLAVKGRGGVTIVQDPREAASAEMPENAVRYAKPNFILATGAIGPKLLSLINVESEPEIMANKNKIKQSSANSGENEFENLNVAYPDEGEGTPSVFACPECHGVLWELKDHDLFRFRCRVGHSYTMDSLSNEFSETTEAALWAAMRALEEKAAMNRRTAESSRVSKSISGRLLDQAESDDANAKLIREMIFAGNGAPKPQEATPQELRKTGTYTTPSRPRITLVCFGWEPLVEPPHLCGGRRTVSPPGNSVVLKWASAPRLSPARKRTQ